uniref:Uncharacterized protein n=1 Tax=viral metagenome TaxID=1070528 RepID=A0A6M3JCK7_9ZZZZ
MYQPNYDTMTGKVSGIKRTSDSASIPLCEDNTDFAAFLEWNALQPIPLDLNTIDAATIAAHEAQKEQAQVDALISQKMRDIAIADLKKEGKLTAAGAIKK